MVFVFDGLDVYSPAISLIVKISLKNQRNEIIRVQVKWLERCVSGKCVAVGRANQSCPRRCKLFYFWLK